MIEGQDIVSVLLHYGAEEVPEGHGWRGMLCCFHEERRPSARVNTEENAFFCNSCGMKGDAISLIMKQEGVDVARAKQRHEDIVGSPLPDVPVSTTHRRRKGRRRLPSAGQSAYDTDAGLFSSGVRRRPFTGG